MSDFNITLFEACEILNRSKKTISRYVRQGKLTPKQVKSQRGTLEYRFSKIIGKATGLSVGDGSIMGQMGVIIETVGKMGDAFQVMGQQAFKGLAVSGGERRHSAAGLARRNGKAHLVMLKNL